MNPERQERDDSIDPLSAEVILLEQRAYELMVIEESTPELDQIAVYLHALLKRIGDTPRAKRTSAERLNFPYLQKLHQQVGHHLAIIEQRKDHLVRTERSHTRTRIKHVQ